MTESELNEICRMLRPFTKGVLPGTLVDPLDLPPGASHALIFHLGTGTTITSRKRQMPGSEGSKGDAP